MRSEIRERLQRTGIVRPATCLNVALDALREAFRKQRSGYGDYFGLTVQNIRSGMRVGWVNSLTNERGVIVCVEESRLGDVCAGLLEELRALRLEGGTCGKRA